MHGLYLNHWSVDESKLHSLDHSATESSTIQNFVDIIFTEIHSYVTHYPKYAWFFCTNVLWQHVIVYIVRKVNFSKFLFLCRVMGKSLNFKVLTPATFATAHHAANTRVMGKSVNFKVLAAVTFCSCPPQNHLQRVHLCKGFQMTPTNPYIGSLAQKLLAKAYFWKQSPPQFPTSITGAPFTQRRRNFNRSSSSAQASQQNKSDVF